MLPNGIFSARGNENDPAQRSQPYHVPIDGSALALRAHNVRPDETGRGTACVGAHIMRPRSVSCRLNGTGCPSCVKQSIYQDCTRNGAVRRPRLLSRCGRTMCARTETGDVRRRTGDGRTGVRPCGCVCVFRKNKILHLQIRCSWL